jgi:hypothetical protein
MWLNLVKTLLGKMACTFPCHIRVDSKAELKENIMRGVSEINASPGVYRWKKFKKKQRGNNVNTLMYRYNSLESSKILQSFTVNLEPIMSTFLP